jgi:hypothetical protein
MWAAIDWVLGAIAEGWLAHGVMDQLSYQDLMDSLSPHLVELLTVQPVGAKPHVDSLVSAWESTRETVKWL